MSVMPPVWAMKKANDIFKDSGGTFTEDFARYIAAHEEAPVDPLLIEAREICAVDAERNRLGIAEQYRAGRMDNVPLLQLTIQGLRRGIEIGKAQA